ncbi:unnamed protein product, partial [Meganyctiphanes norvegica]
RALFAPSCISHTILTKKDWIRVKIDDISLPEALACWESIPSIHLSSSLNKESSVFNQLSDMDNDIKIELSGFKFSKHRHQINNYTDKDRKFIKNEKGNVKTGARKHKSNRRKGRKRKKLRHERIYNASLNVNIENKNQFKEFNVENNAASLIKLPEVSIGHPISLENLDSHGGIKISISVGEMLADSPNNDDDHLRNKSPLILNSVPSDHINSYHLSLNNVNIPKNDKNLKEKEIPKRKSEFKEKRSKRKKKRKSRKIKKDKNRRNRKRERRRKEKKRRKTKNKKIIEKMKGIIS